MNEKRNFAIQGLPGRVVAAIMLAAFLISGANAEGPINKQQIIVRLKPEIIKSEQQFVELRDALLEEWRAEFGIDLSLVRDFRADGFIMAARKPVAPEQLETMIEGINEDPRILYAEPDAIMTNSPARGKSDKGRNYYF